jgi:hypothetical protein
MTIIGANDGKLAQDAFDVGGDKQDGFATGQTAAGERGRGQH